MLLELLPLPSYSSREPLFREKSGAMRLEGVLCDGWEEGAKSRCGGMKKSTSPLQSLNALASSNVHFQRLRSECFAEEASDGEGP